MKKKCNSWNYEEQNEYMNKSILHSKKLIIIIILKLKKMRVCLNVKKKIFPRGQLIRSLQKFAGVNFDEQM